jgi:hypothetical protein
MNLTSHFDLPLYEEYVYKAKEARKSGAQLLFAFQLVFPDI